MTTPPKVLEAGHIPDEAGLWSPRQGATMSGFEVRNYDDNHFSRTTVHSDGRSETQVSGAVRTNVTEWANTQGAPWATARDHRNGSPLAPHEVTGDSILSFANFPAEVTRDQAYALGLLQRPNQRGTPTYAPQGVTTGTQQDAFAATQTQQQQEIHPDLQEEAISPEGEAELGEVFQGTSTLTHAQAFLELATEGAVSEATLAAAATQMGVEPGRVQSTIDNLRPHFEKQADDTAARLGVDPASVWQWAWKTQPGKMQEAIDRQLRLRNTQGYQKIANEYVQKLDTIAPEMILNAQFGNGITAAKARDGVVVLTLPGGQQVGWSEAISAGIVTLSGS